MLDAHYAPSAAVQVVTVDGVDAALANAAGPIGFLGPRSTPLPSGIARLDAPEPFVADALAPVLYRSLRLADALGLGTLIVVAPDGEGLGPAVRDRLTRAANSGP